jgi:hypothetical protein
MILRDMKIRFLILLLSTVPGMAQDEFSIGWSLISGGGTTTAGAAGEFTIEASIGQFAAIDAAVDPGSEFSLSGGYWTFALNEPLELGLAMQINGGTVSLTWDDSTGVAVKLESSTDLQLWTPVNQQPLHPPFLEPTGQRRFYRLMPGQ